VKGWRTCRWDTDKGKAGDFLEEVDDLMWEGMSEGLLVKKINKGGTTKAGDLKGAVNFLGSFLS